MIATHTLPNGLRLATEHVAGAASVSMHLLVPAGSMRDTEPTNGTAAVFLEMLFRGTKSHNNEELSHAFDCAGMQRNGGVGTRFLRLTSTTTTDRFEPAMRLLQSLVTEPSLPESQLDASRELCLQSLAHLADEPQEELAVFLGNRHLKRPLHRSGLGTAEGLAAVTTDDLRSRLADWSVPDGSILAISGGIDADQCVDIVNRVSAPWAGSSPPDGPVTPPPRGHRLIERSTSQVHLAMAWDAPPAGDSSVVLERLVCASLGGTTSSRLFTEVRQRRSLCYSVGTQYARSPEQGWVVLHAGTTPENATELVETCLEETARIAQDLGDEEVERARRSIMSALILQGESSRARAAQMAVDIAHRGHCRSLEQRLHEVEQASCQAVQSYARRYADLSPTIVAIGPPGSLPYDTESGAGA
jgi:predicted Zn-dependent peptidase